MELKDLQGKKLNELAASERQFILDSYLSYFDTCKPRKRAIGYCVALGGVPTSKIGMVDITFNRIFATGEVGYSLSLGPVPLFDNNPKLHSALQDYIQREPRFADYVANRFDLDNDGRGPTLPLFAPTRNSTNDRLANCVTVMTDAGNAIGFNAMSIRLHELHGAFFIPTSFHYEQSRGIDIKNCAKIGAFVTRVKKSV